MPKLDVIASVAVHDTHVDLVVLCNRSNWPNNTQLVAPLWKLWKIVYFLSSCLFGRVPSFHAFIGYKHKSVALDLIPSWVICCWIQQHCFRWFIRSWVCSDLFGTLEIHWLKLYLVLVLMNDSFHTSISNSHNACVSGFILCINILSQLSQLVEEIVAYFVAY